MSNSYSNNLKDNKRTYIILKMLSKDGFTYDELYNQYGISKAYSKRLLASVREALYAVFEDDIQIIYDRAQKRYILIIIRSGFNLINLPLF